MKLVLCALLVSAVAYIEAVGTSPDIIPIPNGVKGDGLTTRYWNCCKPSCAWLENDDASVQTPVTACEIDGATATDIEAQSACSEDGGSSFMCTNQQPWVVNDTLAYGFVGASYKGGTPTPLCCSCLLLNFKGDLAGKSMVVQHTNNGGDVKENRFDISIPGGGVGDAAIGCQRQWNASEHGWGDRYGGVHTKADCSELPTVLQDGCKFRFDFMEGIPNPEVSFYQVKCPPELIAITGCELPTTY